MRKHLLALTWACIWGTLPTAGAWAAGTPEVLQEPLSVSASVASVMHLERIGPLMALNATADGRWYARQELTVLSNQPAGACLELRSVGTAPVGWSVRVVTPTGGSLVSPVLAGHRVCLSQMGALALTLEHSFSSHPASGWSVDAALVLP